MSLCSHCTTVNVPADGGGVLRLTHPLPHTLAKLRRALGERYALGPLPGGVAVRLPAGSLEGVTGLLEAALSAAEREACKVLLLGEGEALVPRRGGAQALARAVGLAAPQVVEADHGAA